MLKIRLQRVGRRNDASFRVVVIESQRGPKAGNALEVLGFYDPKKDVIEIKGDRVTHWISVGAQVSDTVHNLLVKKKIIKGEKINVLPKKNPIKKEEETKDGGEKEKPAAAVGSDVAKEEDEKKPEKDDDKSEVPASAESSGEVKEKPEEKSKKEETVLSAVEKNKQKETKEKPAETSKKEDEKKS